MTILTRRHFTLSALALAAAAAAAAAATPARAQGATKSITTSLGTYDIPLTPQRVVVIDNRLDLEPALALGLPVIAYSLSEHIEPWVPLPAGATYIAAPPTREAVLNLSPDLIICTDIPGSEYWPIDQLKDIAPVLPVDYELSWQDNLARLGDWLDRKAEANAFLAAYADKLAATRAKYADALATKKVAALWYEPDGAQLQFLLGAGSKNVTLAGQVLDDLGGKTVDPAPLEEYGLVSLENMSTLLAEIDAIMLDRGDGNTRREALEASDLWGRVPAVAAGKVYWTEGIYYGGGYGATNAIAEWEKTLALI